MIGTLQIPYPPTANNLFFNAGKRRVKTKAYDAWLAEALAVLRAQRPRTVSGSYRLTIIATRPDKRRRDVANLEKPIGDALVKAGIVEDDSLCQSIQLAWAWDSIVKGGHVALRVEPAEHPVFILGRAA